MLGVSRKEAERITINYPDVDEDDECSVGNNNSWLFINNSFANLLGYPHGQESEMQSRISATASQINEIFQKWRV